MNKICDKGNSKMLNLENLCRSLWLFTVLSCMSDIFYNKGKKYSASKRKLDRNRKYNPKFKTKKYFHGNIQMGLLISLISKNIWPKGS